MSAAALRCRIGLGLGVGRLIEGRSDLAEVTDSLEHLGFDSLWASEVLGSHAPDPVAALAFAAARTSRIKLGTSVMVAPGRSPAQLAKQAATLDVLSDGRFFPVLGLGTSDPDALSALGVERADRGPMTDEMIPLLRRIWADDQVDHAGRFYQLDRYRPHLHPVRRSLPIWLGGRSDAELRRVGAMSDGWLASFAAPDEVERSIGIIRAAAAEADRSIEGDHYGVLMMYSLGPADAATEEFMRWRRPDRSAADVFPEGAQAVVDLLGRFAAAGATKFILVPSARPADWTEHLTELADVVYEVDPASRQLAS
ncbi:MAG: TIGR03619 family F420-dependent LLM class oxidoreductase [Candidatus Nanopelagicales bacterium]